MREKKLQMSVRKAVGLESIGFGLAEGVSLVTSLGVVAVLDKLIPKEAMHAINSTIAKVCVEPFMGPIENVRNKVCSMNHCEDIDSTKTRQERAEAIAKWIVVGGVAWWASILAKGAARNWANTKFEIPHEERIKLAEGSPLLKRLIHKVTLRGWSKQEKMVMLSDEAVHYGSLLLLNTVGLRFTNDTVHSIQGVLEKQGIGKEKAHEMAEWLGRWEIANAAGIAAGMAAVYTKHAYGLPGRRQYQKFADIARGEAMSLAEETGRTI